MPSSLRGRGKFRGLLRRMPDGVRAELGHTMQDLGRRILSAMRGRSPRGATGRFAAGLQMRFAPKTLKLRLGFFLKRRALDPWYARIVDGGRKAQTVNVTRRKNTAPYLMRVKGRQGARVVTGTYKDLRRELGSRLKGVLERSLSRVAGGE